ncbi:hypothetical protein TanjilG_11790 [Lupinus angustifolius]|uniref:Uncharacterized protein n=1 Tax=Lupinus angustifolius TaxID=3871 RepID=A0A4P1R6E8_LUPAN|nr:hypothetical protein TanjilG_11790 [Lupinus angustifolius]
MSDRVDRSRLLKRAAHKDREVIGARKRVWLNSSSLLVDQIRETSNPRWESELPSPFGQSSGRAALVGPSTHRGGPTVDLTHADSSRKLDAQKVVVAEEMLDWVEKRIAKMSDRVDRSRLLKRAAHKDREVIGARKRVWLNSSSLLVDQIRETSNPRWESELPSPFGQSSGRAALVGPSTHRGGPTVDLTHADSSRLAVASVEE